MDDNILKLKSNAEFYKNLYKTGLCDRDMAYKNIIPYLNKVNEKAKELCKKYHRNFKPISFIYFIR